MSDNKNLPPTCPPEWDGTADDGWVNHELGLFVPYANSEERAAIRRLLSYFDECNKFIVRGQHTTS